MKLYSKNDIADLIRSMIIRDRLCRSFMLCGEKGIGKRSLAKYMAMQILCESHSGVPCGSCKNCLMAEHDSHPDIMTLTPSGKSGNFRVDDLRPIVSDVSIASNEGGYKIYIIPGIDKALVAAQNILLKVFEEPPDHVIFIMTAEERANVLPTILSRAMILNVTPASEEECVMALKDVGIDDKKAHEAFSTFGGNIGKCLKYCSGENDKLFETVKSISLAISKGDEYELAKLLFVSDKEELLGILGELLKLICDAAVIKQGASPSSCYSKEADKLSGNIRLGGLLAMYDNTSEAIASLSGNASPVLTGCNLGAQLIACSL